MVKNEKWICFLSCIHPHWNILLLFKEVVWALKSFIPSFFLGSVWNVQEHPGLSKSERKRICGLMDCKKLSMEACMHAATNDRLPLRIVVQVIKTPFFITLAILWPSLLSFETYNRSLACNFDLASMFFTSLLQLEWEDNTTLTPFFSKSICYCLLSAKPTSWLSLPIASHYFWMQILYNGLPGFWVD